jgi:hypothetical protein
MCWGMIAKVDEVDRERHNLNTSVPHITSSKTTFTAKVIHVIRELVHDVQWKGVRSSLSQPRKVHGPPQRPDPPPFPSQKPHLPAH